MMTKLKTFDFRQEGGKSRRAEAIDVWALGITIVCSGQYFSWNKGLSAGFGSYAVALALMGIAYTFLCLCTAELSSTLPFAGGSYGLARVTLGFYAGFIVGCSQIAEYIIYGAECVIILARIIVKTTGCTVDLQPLLYFLIYAVALVYVHGRGKSIFWNINSCLCATSLVILLIYILGSAKYADFHQNAGFISSGDKLPLGERGYFIGGVLAFMRVLPLASRFFVGVESLGFACDEIDQPKKNVPRGLVASAVTLVIASISLIFATSSLARYSDEQSASQDDDPLNNVSLYSTSVLLQFVLLFFLIPLSELTHVLYILATLTAIIPLVPTFLAAGFMHIFGISSRAAMVFYIPGTLATVFGFVFAYGKLWISMASSGLFPPIFKHHTVAYGVGSVIGFCICLLVEFLPGIERYLFNLCLLSAFGSYVSQFIGFIKMRTSFANLPREFRNTLGIPSAIVGVILFTLSTIGVIAFQQDKQIALIAYGCFVAVASVYYTAYAQTKQKFSEDESKILFVAHVVQNNMDRRRQSMSASSQSRRRSRSTSRRRAVVMGSNHGALPPPASGRRSSISRVTSAISERIPNLHIDTGSLHFPPSLSTKLHLPALRGGSESDSRPGSARSWISDKNTELSRPVNPSSARSLKPSAAAVGVFSMLKTTMSMNKSTIVPDGTTAAGGVIINLARSSERGLLENKVEGRGSAEGNEPREKSESSSSSSSAASNRSSSENNKNDAANATALQKEGERDNREKAAGGAGVGSKQKQKQQDDGSLEEEDLVVHSFNHADDSDSMTTTTTAAAAVAAIIRPPLRQQNDHHDRGGEERQVDDSTAAATSYNPVPSRALFVRTAPPRGAERKVGDDGDDEKAELLVPVVSHVRNKKASIPGIDQTVQQIREDKDGGKGVQQLWRSLDGKTHHQNHHQHHHQNADNGTAGDADDDYSSDDDDDDYEDDQDDDGNILMPLGAVPGGRRSVYMDDALMTAAAGGGGAGGGGTRSSGEVRMFDHAFVVAEMRRRSSARGITTIEMRRRSSVKSVGNWFTTSFVAPFSRVSMASQASESGGAGGAAGSAAGGVGGCADGSSTPQETAPSETVNAVVRALETIRVRQHLRSDEVE